MKCSLSVGVDGTPVIRLHPEGDWESRHLSFWFKETPEPWTAQADVEWLGSRPHRIQWVDLTPSKEEK